MKSMKAITTLSAVTLFSATVLTGCGSSDSSDSEKTSSKNADGTWDETITIDVYDELANYMGIADGWFADEVKEKFNMELNIIAPNVAGNGDTLYSTRTASGDLGDLIVSGVGEKFNELTEAGLLIDASEYYADMDNMSKYDGAVQFINEGKDGVYGFPTNVSSLSPVEPTEAVDSNTGAFLRWDLYKQLGYPEIGTLEDLLPILKQMQELQPTSDSGKPTYGFSLFADWDGNMMTTTKILTSIYGYEEMGFTLAKADGSDVQSILQDDGMYIRALKFYNEANQLGLVDPESTTQNWDTLVTKLADGQVLVTNWDFTAMQYNTPANKEQGKALLLAPIADQSPYSIGAKVNGGTTFLGIGSQAEDPERIAAFIDWLYSPEGIEANDSLSMGPEGMGWNVGEDGAPKLDEWGLEWANGGEQTPVPEEFGGGIWADGRSPLNFISVLPGDINPKTNYPYNHFLWPEFVEMTNDNAAMQDWVAYMGADSGINYLQDNDQLQVAPGASYITPEQGSEIETIRNQVKDVIKEYSWRSIFAESDEEFNSLIEEMQNTANGLGYEKVYEFDKQCADEQNAAREEVLAEYNS